MVAIPSVVIVQRYFTRRRAIAAGISSAGIGVFGLIGPLLARLLIDTFGWRGASLLFGGFSLQILVPAVLYRPLEPLIRDVADSQSKPCKESRAKRLKTFVAAFFNKKLFSRFYILFLVANVASNASLGTYYIRVAQLGLSVGIDQVRSAFLLSLVATLAAVARGTSGFMAHWVPPHVLYGSFNMAAALVVLMVPLMPNTFTAHAICAAAYGFCAGELLFPSHYSPLSCVNRNEILTIAHNFVDYK